MTAQLSPGSFDSDSPASMLMNNETNAFQPDSMIVSTNGSTGFDESAYLDPFSYFPTTIVLIVLQYCVFLYHTIWVPRKNVLATYRSIIHRKRFHKLWLAIFSHPPIQQDARPLSSDGYSAWDQHHESRLFPSTTVAMGGPDTDRWIQGGSVMQRIATSAMESGERQWRRLTKGSLSGFPLLLYSSHILWSCRALEQWYGDKGDWGYARCLVSLVVLAITLELCISHALVQATLRRQNQQPQEDAFGEIQPTLERSINPSVLQQIRERVEKRAIGTMTSLASAILVLFHFQYSEIPLAILPFFPDRFLQRYPAITYLICLSILTVLARSNHPMGVVTGGLVGLGWEVFSLDFLADAYHGNCFILAVIFLTMISCKGRHPTTWPCIEYVYWYDPDTSAANDSATHSISWCYRPVHPDDTASSDGDSENDDESSWTSAHHAEHAYQELTRVRSNSDDSDVPPIVDPDLLEQGRRPRRTRIRSQRV